MSAQSPPSPVKPGDVIAGRYRVDGILGIGGIGVVASATHLELDHPVAVKLLQPDAAENPETVQRFLREARSMVKVRSEHIVRVNDVGVDSKKAPYLVMERLEGRDLNQLVSLHGPLPVEDAADYLLQACEALAEAHALGIVHRDLKPSNFFLTRRADGSSLVKLLDFGLAKDHGGPQKENEKSLTAMQSVMGTASYMSPEQIRSTKDVDPRADVWSLGVVLYELVSGRPPFEGAFLAAILAKILSDPHTPLREAKPGLPAGLEQVIDRCLEKKRDKRLPTVAAFAQALAPFAPRSALSIQRILRTTEASARGEHVFDESTNRKSVSARPPPPAVPGPTSAPISIDDVATVARAPMPSYVPENVPAPFAPAIAPPSQGPEMPTKQNFDTALRRITLLLSQRQNRTALIILGAVAVNAIVIAIVVSVLRQPAPPDHPVVLGVTPDDTPAASAAVEKPHREPPPESPMPVIPPPDPSPPASTVPVDLDPPAPTTKKTSTSKPPPGPTGPVKVHR